MELLLLPEQRPSLVVHADWSTHPRKRWQAQARLLPDGRYLLSAPEPVGDISSWLMRLQAAAGSNNGVFLGLDFPIGLPLAYAQRAGIMDFLSLLPGFGTAADGEDRFDAVVGLFGMLNVLLGHRPPGEPLDEQIRRVEGWILGQISRQ